MSDCLRYYYSCICFVHVHVSFIRPTIVVYSALVIVSKEKIGIDVMQVSMQFIEKCLFSAESKLELGQTVSLSTDMLFCDDMNTCLFLCKFKQNVIKEVSDNNKDNISVD